MIVLAPTSLTVSGDMVKPAVMVSFVLSLLVSSMVILERSILLPTTKSVPVYLADIFSAVFATPYTTNLPLRLP